MIRRVLVDTGPLVAIRSPRDQNHQRILELAKELPSPLFCCWPVVTEALYLLRSDGEQVQSLMNAIRSGVLILLRLDLDDVDAIAATLAKYRPLDFADACLLRLADREGIDEILTTDSKDFRRCQVRDGQYLRIVD